MRQTTQTQKELIEQIRQEARTYFEGACPSHDWSHVERVYNSCLYIGRVEKAELFILQLAALLHDVGRQKEAESPDEICHAQISAEIASGILKRYQVSGEVTEQVLHCIISHRFRNNQKPETLEAKVLYDADKLDCIGAIGIARAYAWAGRQGIRLYSDKDFLGTGYEEEHSPVTEFKYKLRQVKDNLFTETAKRIAESRHNCMEMFFERLSKEIEYGV